MNVTKIKTLWCRQHNSINARFSEDYIYQGVKYTSEKIIIIVGFNTNNIQCNIISGGVETDMKYTLNLKEPTVYMINIIPTNVLYQKVTNGKVENIEFHIWDEHVGSIVFNGHVLILTLHLV